MKYKEYFGAIEAILFASGEPVEQSRLATALELDEATLVSMMKDFASNYEEDGRGIRVVHLNEAYQLCTKNEFAQNIKTVLELKRTTPLSQAALETLAVIAYNEPITKSFIEQVRGVDSSGTVNSLFEKGLLEEAGRLEVPGRPIAYRTSPNFLRSFGLESLRDLPPLPNDDAQVKMEEVVQATTQETEE